jgi:hypothetical protein
VSRRTASRLQRASAEDSDAFHREFIFWLATPFLFVLAFWLLSEILLPFIADLPVAYFLTPITDCLARLGVNRLAAVTLVVLALIILLVVRFGRAGARRAFAETDWRERRTASGLADLGSTRLRVSCWLCRAFGCSAARRHDRRAVAFCAASLPSKFVLHR